MSDDAIVKADPVKISEEALLKLAQGDLSSLTMPQRAEYCYHLAVSKGLDPTTQPFNLLVLNGKVTIYANRSASDQIRRRDGIQSERLYNGPLRDGTTEEGKPVFDRSVWEVEYKLTDKDGRVEYSTGCVGVDGAKGETKANAVMKADTKAKRRGTLSMGGLGFLDESEVPQGRQDEAIGEGKPRRVYPRAVVPQDTPQPADDMPIVEATLVEDSVSKAVTVPTPQLAAPTPLPSRPPQFSGPTSPGRPLPAARPPVKV